MPAPKLSWWQKLLTSIGLLKQPVRPPRPERRPNTTDAKKTREPRRSKTRDARTDQSNSSDSEEDNTGKKRRERSNSKTGNRSRAGDPSTVENRRVYVGNLSYDTTESDLEELFKGVGAVRQIEIVYNRSTHRSKGYGFIEMLDIDEAKRTVEVLNDQFFMGRKLTVSGAKSKDHEDAESAEGNSSTVEQTVPELAPINPVKEQVLDLLDEPKTEVATEPAATVTTEETNPEVPTEEFSPEKDASEEVKNQAQA